MSEPKPNWVARQAACQIDAVFEDLLKAVQQDVDAMNALPAHQRRHRHYVYQQQHERGAVVFCTDQDGTELVTKYNASIPMSVIFATAADTSSIQIHQNLIRRVRDKDVTLSWNTETLSCGLIWDGQEDRRLEVWQVSQQALGPLFFDTDDDEV